MPSKLDPQNHKISASQIQSIICSFLSPDNPKKKLILIISELQLHAFFLMKRLDVMHKHEDSIESQVKVNATRLVPSIMHPSIQLKANLT